MRIYLYSASTTEFFKSRIMEKKKQEILTTDYADLHGFSQPEGILGAIISRYAYL
jgi:hypothetical protein